MSKISVILPVYNGVDYLEDCLNSIISQDLKDFELIICDDCSTDDSYSKLQLYAAQYPQKIKLLRNIQNQGLFKTLNLLIEKTGTPLIKLWSQDDVMMNHCLSKIIEFHQKHTNISMSYHRVDYIDEKGNISQNRQEDGTPKIISLEQYCKTSIKWGCMPGNIANVTLVKEYIEKVGAFDESHKVSGDFELWTRLVKEAPIARIEEPLIYLRVHQGQLSNQTSSIYYRIKEDLPIFKSLILSLPANHRPMYVSIFNKKILIVLFNETIFLFRRCKFKLALKAQKELYKYGSIPVILFYWLKWVLYKLLNKQQVY